MHNHGGFMDWKKIGLFFVFACCVITQGVYGQEKPGEDWQFMSARDEITPKYWIDTGVQYDHSPTLAVAGDGKAYSDGSWIRTVDVKPETYYRFRSHFYGTNLDNPNRSVLARILWYDGQGKLLGQAEYPATRSTGGEKEWGLIEQVYLSPENAAQAKIELKFRWDADGSVHFEPAVLEEAEPLPARPVHLATVHFRPRNDWTKEENLGRFAELIAEAAARGADIVCLPEGITYAGSGKSIIEVSEPIPGPTSDYLGSIAKQHNIYIVAGLDERDGEIVYNTAVLIDRDGKLAGKYRKVCLPREEIEQGVTPGSSFPTFETDFGRIGILVCWDISFPEPARMLGLAGAEIILLPIWGGILTLTQARAIENQVYLVSSSYDMKSAIFDQEGQILAEASEENPVAVYEVDLNKQKLWPWLGDFKNRITREMPPRDSIVY